GAANIDGALAVQFKGAARLRGAVGFRIYGKGFDCSLKAHVLAKAPDYLIDANLHFGVRFHIPLKTIEVGGSVPFHWEKRRTPPISSLLKGIALTQPMTGKGASPYLLVRNVSRGAGAIPDVLDLSLIPDVEPDTSAAIEFAFPTKDTSGLPFGQNVVSVPVTKSGEYEFEGKLEGEDVIGVRMRRRRLCGLGQACNLEW